VPQIYCQILKGEVPVFIALSEMFLWACVTSQDHDSRGNVPELTEAFPVWMCLWMHARPVLRVTIKVSTRSSIQVCKTCMVGGAKEIISVNII
jgi:hypothetical protein